MTNAFVLVALTIVPLVEYRLVEVAFVLVELTTMKLVEVELVTLRLVMK